ncbi:portal protein [Polaribacter sp.]|uniref:portal protein n=1 Tax=Polaribacter sp. TaxID=1920175 RepID=UPI0025F48D1C|nr:portal protein [Polaribacter sp.]
MERISPEIVFKRAEKAYAKKENWRDIYEECYEYALPERNLYSGFYENKSPGQNKSKKVFDSTAIYSTQRFANRLQSSLFPPYRNWCRLIVGDNAKNELEEEQQQELQLALDVYSEKMFTLIRQTNFDLSMSEMLLDLAVGTGVMLIQKGDDDTPIRFESVPQYLVALEEGPYGRVDNVYRKHQIRGSVLKQQWADAEIPPDLQKEIDEDPSKNLNLIEATIFLPDSGVYCYHLLHKKANKNSSITELVYRTMDSTPWVVCRFSKIAGEVMGRGPLVSCISDIKTLNKTKEFVLKNASLAISGVYLARDDGILNPQNIQIKPGSVISVASNGGAQGPSLAPLQRSSDFNVSQIVMKDLQDSIRKTLLDDGLPPDDMSARSATEIVAKQKELAQNLGSAFGRLITEALIPIVTRVLTVMGEQNIIELPVKVDGKVIKVVPQSPLAQAQNMDDLQNVLQFMQMVQSVGQVGQVAINQDNAIDYMADKLGIPGSILNSKQERLAIVQQMTQTAMQAQQQGNEQVQEVIENELGQS